MTNPELSRMGGRIVNTKFYWTLSHKKRLALIHDIEKANKFDDLSKENQRYWQLAEEEIKENYEEHKKTSRYIKPGVESKTTMLYE